MVPEQRMARRQHPPGGRLIVLQGEAALGILHGLQEPTRLEMGRGDGEEKLVHQGVPR